MKHTAQVPSSYNKLLIALLLLITVSAVAVAVWALFFRTPETLLPPDYQLPDVEDNAQDIPGDNDQQVESEAGGGSVSLSYSNQVSVYLQDRTIFLYFANPKRSNQSIVLQIIVRDQVIVQSGLLEPGKRVMKLELPESSAKKLSVGGYEGTFSVLYYDPNTGEQSILSTEIPIQISVHK